MPTYVMHIGPPKAGSKYLQTSLAALSGELLNDGICYPTTLFSPKPDVSHRGLARLLQNGRSAELENAFDEFNSGGYQYVCFSNEGFWSLSEEQLVYLRELLAGFEIRIVHYCRRWSERIPSLWKQNVKEGFVETFPEYLVRAISAPVKAPDLNHRLVWDKFANVFGRESIHLVPFNNLVEKDIDLVEHFVETFFNWKYTHAPEGTFSNKSPDLFDCEILRALNAIHLRKAGNTSDQVRVRFLRQRNKLDVDYLLRAMKDDLGKTVVSDHFQVFEPIYAQMCTYRDRLVSRQYGENFFRFKANACSYVQQNYLLDDQVARELHRLYEEIWASPSARPG
jgi:hypothetical protein